MIQVTQMLNNAVREGARIAAGGTLNDVPVTVAMVQAEVKDYMTAAGLPTTAVNGATVTVTNLSGNSWTDPGDALPLDRFRVTVTIPSGAAYNSLRWNLFNSITGKTSLSVSRDWLSAIDTELTVSASVPY
jgi:hypothetical protein